MLKSTVKEADHYANAFSRRGDSKAPPQVWEALTDWTSAHRWMPGIDGMAAEEKPPQVRN